MTGTRLSVADPVALAQDGLPALRRVARPEHIPLSFAQRRLWFLHRINGPEPSYNVPITLRLTGVVNAQALAKALADLVVRHESLRTVFYELDGEPYQRILDPRKAVPAVRRTTSTEAELPRRLQAAAARTFDLSRDIPLRAELFTLSAERHVLSLTLHHITCDGWSSAPLAEDLAIAYHARCSGHAPHWRDLAVQYADYAIWQQALFTATADQHTYWSRALAGLPGELPLPVDRERPSTSDHSGGLLHVRISARLHRGVVTLGHRTRSSTFMVLHAALAALLTRLGAGTDIPIGSPIADRSDSVLDGLIGLFVNTLVLRVDTGGNPTFTELLRRIREADLGAYSNQDTPFEYLVETLNPARHPARHPLFQVMLSLQNTPHVRFHLPGLLVQEEAISTGTSRFDLAILMAEDSGHGREPEGISALVEYSAELFDQETVELLMHRLQMILDAMTQNPDQPIGEVDILTREERERLLPARRPLRQWHATVAEMIHAQALDSPDVVAVEFGQDRLTYQDLDALANRLARHLRALGLGPERIAAVALPRCMDLITALLAILKAGAAYLPIDLDYPDQRIAVVLKDARPSLLLTQVSQLGRLASAWPVLLLDDDDVKAAVASHSDDDVVVPSAPDNPAYIIYTSGSTGVPKGVVMPSRTISNLISWHVATLPGGVGTRVGQFTAIGFDFSLEEILASLAAGKTLVLPSDELRRDGELATRWLEQSRINELYGPTSLIDALLESAAVRGRSLPHLTDILQAGEAFTVGPQLHHRAGQSPLRVHNLYGPAETHAVTAHTLSGDSLPWPGVVPIGTPVNGAWVFILDDRLRPVPPGVTGELCVTGAVLARGYLNQPAMTAERFLPCPFRGPGERMYRTGDLARWNRSGHLEFLGRADQQVKIRGFRVEPGEVEARLAMHPDVANAAVIRQDNQSLIAYAIPRGESSFDPAEVRDFVAAALPGYMVPARVIKVPALALTVNGKLDKGALPGPDEPDQPRRAVRDPREEMLCGLFAEILGLRRVDAEVQCRVHDRAADRIGRNNAQAPAYVVRQAAVRNGDAFRGTGGT
jgi:amino acid adenylation domain-containing protein